MYNFEGKTAIISGGANGIGRTLVEAFAKNKCNVAMLDIDDAAGKRAEHEVSKFGISRFYHCDVSSIEQINSTFRKIVIDFGGVDILVNNAGVSVRELIEDIDEETWDHFTAVNEKSVFFFSKLFAEHIRERSSGYGRIINMSSIRAKVADATHSGYTITKAAGNAITKCFAVNYGKYGVTANAIAPAFVLTPMTEHYMSDPQAKDIIKTVSPIGRGVDPREIAELALFMASPWAEAMNGQVILMDGGGFCLPGVFA